MVLRVCNLFRILILTYLYKFHVLSHIIEEESPLFLTPFLEDGNITEARERARVHHSEMQNVESYSGFFTTNKKFNSNMYFWYFPSRGNPATDPVILWLQGGPGATSLYGLFTENGPFIITKSNTLELRNLSWTNNHSVLYIDSPVGSGFSFTNDETDYARNVNDITFNLYMAVQQFFMLFPELRKNEFYIMGESYSGKYVPAISYVIHKANENANITNKINLAGLAIGNGLTDPINQLEYYEYLYQLGLLDANGRDIFRDSLKIVKDLLIAKQYDKASKTFDLVFRDIDGTVTLFQNLTGFKYYFNHLYTKEPERFLWFEKWVQQTSVRKALHVGNQEFIPSSRKVLNFMAGDILTPVVDVFTALVERYRVLIFFGQLDLALSLSSSRNFIRQLDWSGSEEYKKAARHQWFVENELAGYTKCAHNLTEVLVRNAGHMVPADQPLWASVMIKKFTRNEPLC